MYKNMSSDDNDPHISDIDRVLCGIHKWERGFMPEKETINSQSEKNTVAVN